MTDGNKNFFRMFDEHTPSHGGFPRLTCKKCSNVFSGRHLGNSKSSLSSIRSCSACANMLFFDFEGEILNGYFFDFKKHPPDEIDRIILSNIKPCPCGGRFHQAAVSKCPFCFSEIDRSVLVAYEFVTVFPDEAFLTSELREDYESLLKEKTAGNKLYYKHGFELAIEFKDKGYLKNPSEDQGKRLRQCLPFHAGSGVLASQWLMEKPKRDLFEIYMDKLFEPAQPGRELASVMLQYNIAHAISVLAGSPFEKKEMNLSVLQPSKEFEDVILRNQDVMNKVAGGWRQEERDAMLRKVKKRNLFGLFGKHSNFLLRNQNEVTVPFIHRAQKEIDHWRNWWNENKDALPT